VILVSRIDNLVGDAPGPSGADESTSRHAHSVELVKGIADRRGDLSRLMNVPRVATDIIALAHRQYQHLSV
jgi:hypothetical protein